MNDRALRKITIGLGGKRQRLPAGRPGSTSRRHPRSWRSPPSRAICRDLRARLGRITAGYSRADGKPVTAEDLRAAGAMTVLLKDALKPNLVQTLEGQPALVHCGPLGITDHGNNSLVADLVAAAAWRVRGHRVRIRLGHGDGEVLQPRLPGREPDARSGGPGGLGTGGQASRRRRRGCPRRSSRQPERDRGRDGERATAPRGSSRRSACPPWSRSTGERAIQTRRSTSSSAWRSKPARSPPA